MFRCILFIQHKMHLNVLTFGSKCTEYFNIWITLQKNLIIIGQMDDLDLENKREIKAVMIVKIWMQHLPTLVLTLKK